MTGKLAEAKKIDVIPEELAPSWVAAWVHDSLPPMRAGWRSLFHTIYAHPTMAEMIHEATLAVEATRSNYGR